MLHRPRTPDDDQISPPDQTRPGCALTYPPQRIVVDEVRQQECLDPLIALNLGDVHRAREHGSGDHHQDVHGHSLEGAGSPHLVSRMVFRVGTARTSMLRSAAGPNPSASVAVAGDVRFTTRDAGDTVTHGGQ
jgi:hypothetical protein